jgi:3',5'-cyclic-AMP phosphodiesterase
MQAKFQSSSLRAPDTSGRPLLIAQITDIHLGFDADNPQELNRLRLDAVLHDLCASHHRPDLIVASGDLTEAGREVDYRTLREIFDACPIPILPMMGNHDLREPFAAVFSDVPMHDGFVQYVIDAGPLRLVLLDTLEVGRHGGGFCERRVRWLADRLAEAPDRPTILFAHHPPIRTGIDWMTISEAEPWARAIERAVSGHDQIVALFSGHIHRPITAAWAGTRVSVCPSSAPQVALDLRTIDPSAPDGRAMIVAEAPGYMLHLWDGQSLVSHVGMANGFPVLASYTPQLQPMVQDFLEERDGAQSSKLVASSTL